MAKQKQSKKSTVSVDEILATIEAAKHDVEKFNGGTQAAGARIRKAAQESILMLKQLRKDVIEIKHAR